MTQSEHDNQMDGAEMSAQHGDVRAEHVQISQGGASSITAQTVTLSQGGAARIRATDVSISQGGVAMARVDRLELKDGAAALAVVANQASMSGTASTFLLVAGRTDGPVTTAIDVRAAAAFGAAFALVLVLLRRIF